MQRLGTHARDRNEGGIAVVVALLLVVMLGAAALAFDTGNIYWERRQLQNAADASALALAADCVQGIVDCDAAPALLAATLQPLADANANDGRVGMPSSASHGEDPRVCEPNATAAANPLTGPQSVKVTTSTIDGTNADEPFLTMLFARFLGVDTLEVGACATAEWGWAGSLTTIPLALSNCDFALEEPAPTPMYPGPHPNPSASLRTILFHQGTGGSEPDCVGPAGMDLVGGEFLPAGFGWLANDGNCQVTTTVVDGEEWIEKEPGANPECGAAQLAPLLETVIQLPVFIDFCRPPHDAGCPTFSNKDKYRIGTYAAFYLRGYRLGGGPAYNAGVVSCSGSQRCITGYFTTTVAGDGVIGGPPGGVTVVRLSG